MVYCFFPLIRELNNWQRRILPHPWFLPLYFLARVHNHFVHLIGKSGNHLMLVGGRLVIEVWDRCNIPGLETIEG
jgi:hypothetical protein